MEKKYYKLVRDNIPEIIEASGKKANYRIVTDRKDLLKKLSLKLLEEAKEFVQAVREDSNYLEELQDVWDVINEFIYDFLTVEELLELHKIGSKKWKEKGGFSKHIYLYSVEDKE